MYSSITKSIDRGVRSTEYGLWGDGASPLTEYSTYTSRWAAGLIISPPHAVRTDMGPGMKAAQIATHRCSERAKRERRQHPQLTSWHPRGEPPTAPNDFALDSRTSSLFAGGVRHQNPPRTVSQRPKLKGAKICLSLDRESGQISDPGALRCEMDGWSGLRRLRAGRLPPAFDWR